MAEKVISIPVDKIDVKDSLHRQKLDIDSLAESIRTIGQINPITVKKSGARFQVIAGRRRLTALKLLQEQTGKKQIAQVVVKDIDAIQEELIFIDENLMRQDLSETEFDEALFRRKQLYEQLHPETKKHVAGGVGKSAKAAVSKKAFTEDSATKLNVSRRTVEKAIARASKATDAVKKARDKGELSPSKVDLIVTLDPPEQDILLPVLKGRDVNEVKQLVETAKRRGAKAVVLTVEEQQEETAEMKALLREASRLNDALKESLITLDVLEGEFRHDSYRLLEETAKNLSKFLELQRSRLGHIQAIRRRNGEEKRIRARFG